MDLDQQSGAAEEINPTHPSADVVEPVAGVFCRQFHAKERVEKDALGMAFR